jgi:hypothetical protein
MNSRLSLYKYNIIIIFLAFSLFLVLKIEHCLDIANYRLFIDNSSFLTPGANSPVLFLYWVANVSESLFRDKNLSAILLIQAFNVLSYYLLVAHLSKSKNIGVVALLTLCLLPIWLSPILVHFFACTFKQALSLNFLTVAYVFWNHSPRSRAFSILCLLISLTSHWSAILVIISVFIALLIFKLSLISQKLFFYFKIKLPRMVSSANISFLYLIFLIVIILSMTIFYYSQDFSEIIAKANLYAIGEESRNTGYGTKFTLALFPAATYLFLVNIPFLRQFYKHSLPLPFSCLLASVSIAFMGYSLITQMTGPIVRLLMELQYLCIFFTVLTFEEFCKTRPIHIVSILFLTVPSLFYTISHIG